MGTHSNTHSTMDETCDFCDNDACHLVRRDAGYDEWTCVVCHREQYPEEYDALDALQTVSGIVDDIKVKLTDQEFLTLMNSLGKVHKAINAEYEWDQLMLKDMRSMRDRQCVEKEKRVRELKEEIDDLNMKLTAGADSECDDV